MKQMAAIMEGAAPHRAEGDCRLPGSGLQRLSALGPRRGRGCSLPKSNVLGYRLENGTARSWCAPPAQAKIKIYLSAKADSRAESDSSSPGCARPEPACCVWTVKIKV